MILQELVHYYDRAGDLAPEGWEWKRIPYVIEIRADGSLIQLTSLRTGGKSSEVKASLVPKAENRSGTKAYEKPNLLWDHYGFVLGHAKSNDSKDLLAAERQHVHFVKRIDQIVASGGDDPGLLAVAKFLHGPALKMVQADPLWSECVKVAGCNFTFRLAGDQMLVVQRNAIRAMVDSRCSTEAATLDTERARCLVTGELSSIQPLHFPIAGVCEKPAPMAAVNDGVSPAYSSFGKSQGFNFPVGEEAVFKYTTALNRLLQPDSRQRLRVGDMVVVFWAQSTEDADIEDGFASFFDELPDNPNAHTGQVRALFTAIHSGRFAGTAGDRLFFVLGLAPNSARVVVRLWQAAALRDIAYRIKQWFDELELVHSPSDTPHPALYHLLRYVALKREAKNVPPNLGGDILRAILGGTPFPALWLNAAVMRCRAERDVPYLRAAAIKACLLRGHPLSPQEDPKAMLDRDNPNAAYRLGRLFAVLEKIQEEANPGLNATIRERYYGAASSTPVAVFTTLLRLKNHHLAKLTNRGRATNFEKLIGEITGGISDFPLHLPLPEQGRFALGYYHQRQDLFTKTVKSPEIVATKPLEAPDLAANQPQSITPVQTSLL
jgi:CRISPR-associated protein Csd1